MERVRRKDEERMDKGWREYGERMNKGWREDE